MNVRFIKMNGFGNDFIIVDNRYSEYKLNWNLVAMKFCNRRLGIGADGLIVLEESDKADIFWKIFNRDGSVVEEKCGNGLACIARYFHDNIKPLENIKIESKLGIINVEVKNETIKVNMGYADFIKEITVTLSYYPIKGYYISIGNPHFVVIGGEMSKKFFYKIAPSIEKDITFKNGTNVHLVRPDDQENLSIETWERNIGRVLSCASGACAAAIAYKSIYPSIKSVYVKSAIGKYLIELDSNIILNTEAEESYRGEIKI